MSAFRASITSVAAYVPPHKLTNAMLETMVDTSDEWIVSRTGINERRILKEKDLATSDMGAEAVKQLLSKRGIDGSEIELLICATVTPDMPFPATANLICDKSGLTNAFSYDLGAACSGFLFALETGRRFIESGDYKKVIIVGADTMSSIIDYSDRNTCIIFGDGAGAVLLEPTTQMDIGIQDSILKTDGSGSKYLHQKAGGSLNPTSKATIEKGMHYVYQEGKHVFKFAVSEMSGVCEKILAKNNLSADDVDWLVPHQANLRIIEATRKRIDLAPEKVMLNIQKYGNTTAGTLPICLAEWEDKLKKGDKLILTTFGGGFTWGAAYLVWAY
ncbi:MAG: 3-oxoacyl-[acyl-carrier-protein] synthase-3 [Chitinophagales bacterium]|jgi:3-oxoacyl-[acyl-carrier-protein] synthase-3